MAILAQNHHWGDLNKWLNFGDLDLISKVTRITYNFGKALSALIFRTDGQILTKLG